MSTEIEESSIEKMGETEHQQVHLEEGNKSVASLKYTKNGILLDPQPSDDPHDPLNFSALEKACVLIALAYWAFLGTTNLIVVSPAFFMISENYNVTLDSVAYTINGPLVAYVLNLGPHWKSDWIATILPDIYFRGGDLIDWAALAPNFSQFVAARVLAAIFYASPEAYGPQIVADTFFLHQRATATGFFTAFQFCGFTFASFIGGFATLNHGWRASSWVMVIMTYIAFFILAFLFPETSYTRGHSRGGSSKRRYMDTLSLRPSSGGCPPKSSSLWDSFVAPWKYILHPTVLLATLFFSLFLATNDYLLTTNSISFPVEYGFTLRDVALTSFAPTLGNLVGIILGGYVNDKYVMWQRARADGVFIPEMRLPMGLVTAVLGPAGLVLFGTATQRHLHWIAPLFAEFMVNFSAVVAGNITYTYMADVYLRHADSALVMLNALKNLTAFGLVYAVTPWNTHSGYAISFGCLAVILFAAHSPLLLLYYKGASLQRWESKKFHDV